MGEQSLQDAMDMIVKWLPLLLPLIIIQYGLLIFAIVDIVRKKTTKTLNIMIWIIIVCFVNMLGPVLYFVFGRADAAAGKNYDGDDDDI